MQQLKPEIEAKIFDAGRLEFLDKGYARATMRGIAARAGISLGNLYTYFNGKEALFIAIVKPVHRRIGRLLSQLFEEEIDQGFRDKAFLGCFIARTATALAGLIRNNREDLILLLDKSDGTPYEGFKRRLIRLIERDFKEDLRIQNAGRTVCADGNGHLYLIARNLVEAIVETARWKAGDEKNGRTLLLYMHYHLNGMASLLDVEDGRLPRAFL